MISAQGEYVYGQIKNIVGPMLKSMIDVPIPIRRQQFEETMSRTPIPTDIEVEEMNAHGITGEWVRCPHETPLTPPRTIIYLHGGGYVMGSARAERVLTATLARKTNHEILAINYRLAPENPFPAALDDTLTVYHWLREQGRSPEQIVLAGFSAGGSIALSTLIALRDTNQTLPAGAILLSAAVDLARSGQSHRENIEADIIETPQTVLEMCTSYLGEKDAHTPLASPLYAELNNLPPLLIQVGNDELLRDDSVQLAARAQTAGVDVTLLVAERLWHGWHVTTASAPFPEGEASIQQIADFTARLSQTSTPNA